MTDGNLQGFTLAPQGTNGDTPNNGTTTFETPPQTPPLGTKALRLKTNTGKSVAAFLPPRPGNDQPLLSELSTATYSQDIVNQVSPWQSVSFKITVVGADTVRTDQGGFATFVFDPSNQSVQPTTGKFLRYFVLNGKFFSTRTLRSGRCENTAASVCSFQSLVADNPNAVITSIRVEVGNNANQPDNAGFDAFVDDIRIGFDGSFDRFDLGG